MRCVAVIGANRAGTALGAEHTHQRAGSLVKARQRELPLILGGKMGVGHKFTLLSLLSFLLLWVWLHSAGKPYAQSASVTMTSSESLGQMLGCTVEVPNM